MNYNFFIFIEILIDTIQKQRVLTKVHEQNGEFSCLKAILNCNKYSK